MSLNIRFITVLLCISSCNAFPVSTISSSQFSNLNTVVSNRLKASKQVEIEENDDTNTRRSFLHKSLQTAFLTISTNSILLPPDAAHATYSAYTEREKDWEQRQNNGQVQYSTARDLRRALREVAPMNSENSKVFCPNGTSSAVSPLMENKCNDRETAPSVFGRTEDVMGNSIPGFKGGKYPAVVATDGSPINSNPEVGGFPKYN